MMLRTRKQRIDFFQKQFELIQLGLEINEVKAANELARTYSNVFKTVKGEIGELFEKYARDGKLLRDDLMKYGRLMQMQTSIHKRLSELGLRDYELTQSYIRDAARYSYMRSRYAATEGLGLNIKSYGVNERVVEASVFNPLDKIGIRSRIELNLTDSTMRVTDAVNEAITRGLAYDETAKLITDVGESAFKRAVRIVRTEQHRAANTALEISMQEARDAGEELGIEIRKRWLTAKDSVVRDSHGYLDGQLSDELGYFYSDRGEMTLYPGGFGIAEEDINCRCTMTQEIISDSRGELSKAITVEPFEKWNKANERTVLYGG